MKLHPGTKHEDLVIYTTTQTHSLGLKAGLVLGVPCRALEVAPEDNFALRGLTLRTALEEDSKRGKHPFVLGEISRHFETIGSGLKGAPIQSRLSALRLRVQSTG